MAGGRRAADTRYTKVNRLGNLPVPIRFQVDPDFYDHPKAIGMSDAATALWVRAGSYSAAKLTDGFIAEAALSLLTRCPEEASGELVMRGLWRRVKGGFRFHQWDHRNLTRARVQAEKESDRVRKQQERAAARQTKKAQAAGQFVRPDSEPDSDRNPDGIRPLSVSVSVSESVSGSGHDPPAPPSGPAPEPPPRCRDHLDDPDPPPCGRCGDARKAAEAWHRDQETAQRRAASEARSAAAHDRAQVARAAINACQLCDNRGYAGALLCSHDPSAGRRTANGVAAARAAATASWNAPTGVIRAVAAVPTQEDR